MSASMLVPSPPTVRILVPKTNIGAGVNAQSIVVPANNCEKVVLVASLRSLTAAGTEVMFGRLNGDSGNNYNFAWVQDGGGIESLGGSANVGHMGNWPIAANSASADYYTAVEITIFNANSAQNKNGQIILIHSTGTNIADHYVNDYFIWKNNAVLSSFLLTLTAGNFNTGSWYEVYGHLNS